MLIFDTILKWSTIDSHSGTSNFLHFMGTTVKDQQLHLQEQNLKYLEGEMG